MLAGKPCIQSFQQEVCVQENNPISEPFDAKSGLWFLRPQNLDVPVPYLVLPFSSVGLSPSRQERSFLCIPEGYSVSAVLLDFTWWPRRNNRPLIFFERCKCSRFEIKSLREVWFHCPIATYYSSPCFMFDFFDI